jgi:predicted SnoaL-like aldol condensation-catalyzing enzyme
MSAARSAGRCVAVTRAFWTAVFVNRNADVSMDYMSTTYIQHSPPPIPQIGEWIPFWKGVFAETPYGAGKDFPEAQKDYKTDILSIVGDESFAALHAHDHGTWTSGPDKGKPFSFRYYDIFRCENGKLAEHWYSDNGVPGADQ